MRPASTEWDDPEEFPEDEDPDVAPGAPPQQLFTEGDMPLTVYETLGIERRLTPDIRQRRRQRITDHLATREYRERRKHELREEHGGRFA